MVSQSLFRSMAIENENSPPPPPLPSPPSAIMLRSPNFLSSSSQSHLVTFQLKIYEKLDEKNFLIWRRQIEPVINAHNHQDFLYLYHIPPQFILDSDSGIPIENPEFRLWY